MNFSSSEEINEESVELNNWKVKISIILEVTLQKKKKILTIHHVGMKQIQMTDWIDRSRKGNLFTQMMSSFTTEEW